MFVAILLLIVVALVGLLSFDIIEESLIINLVLVCVFAMLSHRAILNIAGFTPDPEDLLTYAAVEAVPTVEVDIHEPPRIVRPLLLPTITLENAPEPPRLPSVPLSYWMRSTNTKSAPSYGALRRRRSPDYPGLVSYNGPIEPKTPTWAPTAIPQDTSPHLVPDITPTPISAPELYEVQNFAPQATATPAPFLISQVTGAPTFSTQVTQQSASASRLPQRKRLCRSRKSAPAPISRSSSTSSGSGSHRAIISRSVKYRNIAKSTRSRYYAIGVRQSRRGHGALPHEEPMDIVPPTSPVDTTRSFQSTSAPGMYHLPTPTATPGNSTMQSHLTSFVASIPTHLSAPITSSPTTSGMVGLSIAGDDAALDAAATPEATMTSPSLTSSDTDMSMPGTPTSGYGSPMEETWALESPFHPSASVFPGSTSPMATSTTWGSPMVTPGFGASPMSTIDANRSPPATVVPAGSLMLVSTPNGAPPALATAPDGSPMATTKPDGYPTMETTPRGPPYPPPPHPTPEGSPPPSTTPPWTPSGPSTPHATSAGSTSPFVEPRTPGSPSLNVSQGPSATTASSPSHGSDASDDEEYQILEADGVAYTLTEESRQRMIWVIKLYLGQQSRSTKLRTYTDLERRINRMEKGLRRNWPGEDFPVGTPRRDQVLTVRAQGRSEQRGVRGVCR